MKIAIITVLFNSEKNLPEYVKSLQEANLPEAVKFFIIDNDSQDNSVKYIEQNFPEAELIKNSENTGFAIANNQGMKKALDRGFDYIYLLNDDTAVHPEFLNEALKLIRSNEKIGAVQSLLFYHQDKNKINTWGNEIHFLGFGYSGGNGEKLENYNLENKKVAYFSGAGVLLKTEVLEKVGFFDENLFMYHEDLDLGWRMRLADYEILLAKDSIVYHKYSFSKSIKKYYFMERNRFIVIFKNYHLLTLLLIFPGLIFMEMGLFLFSVLGGFWKEKIKVYLYFLNPMNWWKVFNSRAEVQNLRKISDRKILKNFTGEINFQEMQSPLLKYIANPVFNFYLWILKIIVKW